MKAKIKKEKDEMKEGLEKIRMKYRDEMKDLSDE